MLGLKARVDISGNAARVPMNDNIMNLGGSGEIELAFSFANHGGYIYLQKYTRIAAWHLSTVNEILP
jgi:hypothetical protein